PSAECRDRVAQPFAAIDAVGEDMPQPGEALPQRTKQRDRAVIVLDVGAMHQDGERKALRVGDHVALASLDPLGGVKPAWPAAFRGLGALAVDPARGGNGVAAHRFAGSPYQWEIDPPPPPLVAPAITVILHHPARRDR